MDGIVVSNHGGRQVDGAIATMDALPAIVEAVAGRIPMLLDSGVRSGADVFRALALGASAVGLGRPYVWGLAAGGEDGVREVIRNLRADFDLTMGLAGVASVARHRPRQRDARLSEIEAVVFDLDGVLVDSEHVWDEVREELARERGGTLARARSGRHDGHELAEWSRYMHDVIGLAESPEEINDEVVRRMLARYAEELPLIDGAVDAVRRLRRLVPARASPRPRTGRSSTSCSSAAASRELFEATVSSEEVARGKPAPDVFLEAARRLGGPARAVRRDRGLGKRHPRRARRGDARHRDPEPPLPAAERRARARRLVLDSLAELAPRQSLQPGVGKGAREGPLC